MFINAKKKSSMVTMLWTQYKQSGLLSLFWFSLCIFGDIPSLKSNKTKGKKEHYTLLHCKMFKLPYAFHMLWTTSTILFHPTDICHATTDSTVSVTAHYIISKLMDMPNYRSISHFRCWWASDWGPIPTPIPNTMCSFTS